MVRSMDFKNLSLYTNRIEQQSNQLNNNMYASTKT